MSLDSERLRFRQLLASIGRANLSSTFPDDFEYYSVALELVDSQGVVTDSLVFPVMPQSITETHPNIINIKKSSNAVVSLHTGGFIPFTINVVGNFGRKMRLMIGNNITTATAFRYNTVNDGLSTARNAVFNTQIKTGYGCIRVLEGIKKKSVQLDSKGLPYKVFFYNLAFGNSNLVEIMNFSKSMNESINMIHNYSMELRAIAPANSIMPPNSKRLQNLLVTDNINKALAITMDAFTGEFAKRQSSRIVSNVGR